MPGRVGGGDHEPRQPGEPEQHPDLGALGGELRAEWRAEQEAAAADAAAHWRHNRTIADWLRDRMHAGDRVGVYVGTRAFVGPVGEVGDDLVVLRGPSARIEIHLCGALPTSFELIEHARSGGTRSDVRRTFRDALLARDGQGELEIGTSHHPHGVVGRLFVARDHVIVEDDDGVQIVVPLAQVAWVCPAPR